MFIKFFKNQQATITSAAIIIATASLTSRALGVLRDRILAGTFGAGENLDMYYTAFRLPDLVYNLLVLGALSAGFIPVLVSYIKHEHEPEKNQEAWELVNNILNLLAISLIIISTILLVASGWLVKILAPGFTPEQQNTTLQLIRIMSLSPILLGLSSIFGGVLQSFKRFLTYSLSPIFYNLGIIVGALFFVKHLGIYGLAWGVVLGSCLHFLSQWIFSWALGYRYQKIIDIKHLGLRKILKMLVPRTLSLSVTQLSLVFITIIASTLEKGSITVFNLANNLQSFPVGIFGISFAIAAFPTLSELANNDQEGFIKNFSNTFRQIVFFVVPLSFLLIVLRAQTVRLVLGSGNFDWQDTIATMNVLTIFCLSLVAQALIPLVVRSFYAYHDSQTPFYVAIFSEIINVILVLFFTKILTLGSAGLALAFTISTWVNIILLIITLRSKLNKLDGTNILYTTLKITFASTIAVLITQSCKQMIGPFTGTETFLRLLTQAILSGSAGIITYGILCWLLKVQEMIIFFESFKKKLLRFKKLPAINISEGEDINVG